MDILKFQVDELTTIQIDPNPNVVGHGHVVIRNNANRRPVQFFGVDAEALSAIVEALRVLAEHAIAVDDLVKSSRGVSGLHLNGDEAPWEDLICGGYGDWLGSHGKALRLARELKGIGQ